MNQYVQMGSENSKSPTQGLGLQGFSKKSQKQPENRIFGVLAKIPTIQIYTFLLQYEISNGLLTFCKNNMFWKNVLLELWSKNLKTNQIAGFFKLQ